MALLDQTKNSIYTHPTTVAHAAVTGSFPHANGRGGTLRGVPVDVGVGHADLKFCRQVIVGRFGAKRGAVLQLRLPVISEKTAPHTAAVWHVLLNIRSLVKKVLTVHLWVFRIHQ